MTAHNNQTGYDETQYDDILDPATRAIAGHAPAPTGRANRNVTLPDFLEQEIRVCSAIAHLHVDATSTEIQAAEDSAMVWGQG